jgi:hypothetical protein
VPFFFSADCLIFTPINKWQHIRGVEDCLHTMDYGKIFNSINSSVNRGGRIA